MGRAINDKRTLGAFLKHMLERDLSDFDVRDVPHTAALDDQKAASFTTEEKWLVDILDKGVGMEGYFNTHLAAVPWQDEIPTDSLAAPTRLLLCARCRALRHAPRPARPVPQQVLREGAPGRGRGRPRYAYRFGPLDAARARFCEVQDIDIKWGGRS